MIADDVMRLDQRLDQRLIADIADDERHAARDCGAEAGRQIVEHDHALAGIGQEMHHMTADIAGSRR